MTDLPRSLDTKNSAPLIVARGVRKTFGSFEALKDFDFTVHRGQCIGLLGPNGAGKSTFIGMIYGVVQRSGGELRVFGRDPAHESSAIKRRLGIVTQDNALDESLTVAENIRLYAAFEGLSRRLAEERMTALLESMNLSHKRNATIQSLSGGMKRRLVFVRALLSNPDLLILDEPTTGLDPAVRLLLWNKVRELREKGTTILLTTHYMHEAEALCDHVSIVNAGHEIASGSPQNLIHTHVPGYVAQFHFDSSDDGGKSEVMEKLIRHVQENPRIEMLKETYGALIRAPDLETLMHLSQGIGRPASQLRPTNLEDVFLKLTGQALSEDA